MVTTTGDFLGYIHLELSRDHIDHATHALLQQFLVLELLLLIFSTIAGVLLANYFHYPLKEAVASANRIAMGNYDVPPNNRSDEFGELSCALQQMGQQIDETIHALNGAQLEMEEIFRSMTDGVLLIDRSGIITKLNQRMEILCHRLHSDLVGQPLSMIIAGEYTLDSLHGDGIEKILLRPEDEVSVQVSGALIHPPHLDHPIGSVIVIHDLSDRMRAESQEQYAAFQAGIAEMGASVLHNIGNVITGMTGHIIKLQSRIRPLEKLIPALNRFAEESERNAKECDDTETLRSRLIETTKVLKSSTDSFARIHQQFDNLKKLESGIRHIGDIISIQQSASRPVLTATRFNLKQLVDDTYSLIDERLSKYSVEWRGRFSAEITTVQLPRNPLMQLLLNLIKNSLEAIIAEMLENQELVGVITLTVEPQPDGHFSITITDNGCGIKPEQLEKIFTPRYTTKSTGSGYGLHSAINFVRQIDGKIEAESDGPHSGARIILTLPLKVEKEIAADINPTTIEIG